MMTSIAPGPDAPDRLATAAGASPRGWWKRWLDSLERLSTTRANNRVSMVLDVITAIALLAAGAWQQHVRLLPALAVIAIGLLAFSWIEYVFHRWIFHGDKTLDAFRKGHENHHVNPLTDAALPFFLPPAIVLLLVGLLALAMPLGYALLLMGAVALGYACYDWGHLIMHIRRFRNPWLRKWASYHHIHHYHPDYNFGVTSPLWDYAFGTLYVSASRKPAVR